MEKSIGTSAHTDVDPVHRTGTKVALVSLLMELRPMRWLYINAKSYLFASSRGSFFRCTLAEIRKMAEL